MVIPHLEYTAGFQVLDLELDLTNPNREPGTVFFVCLNWGKICIEKMLGLTFQSKNHWN